MTGWGCIIQAKLPNTCLCLLGNKVSERGAFLLIPIRNAGFVVQLRIPTNIQ